MALVSFIMYLVIVGCFYNTWYMPLVDRSSKSPRLITDHLEPYKNTKEFYMFGFNSAGVIFYIDKPVHMSVDIEEIEKSKNDILLIAENESSAKLKEKLEKAFRPIDEVKYERDHYYTLYVRENGR